MAKPFAIAEGKRIEITQQQIKQIKDMYKEIERDFKERIRILSNRNNISSVMRTQYLKDFSKDLSREIEFLNSQLQNTIVNNMTEVAKAVAIDSIDLAKSMGFDGIFTANYTIPKSAVQKVISGKLYEGKWTLSKAIWSDNQKKLNDINTVIAKGLASNKSTYEIAKDLERYVNPNARKLWDWSKVYPGTSKKIDYNAQRLARTMISHAYQESFVESTKDNPFIDSYRWLASGGDRMCEICAERDDKIFPKDELPLDHPNGMCTFEPVISKSYDQIAMDLRNWVDNEGDPELDKQLDHYATTLGYNVKDWTAQNVSSNVTTNNSFGNKEIPATLSKDYDKALNEFHNKRANQIKDMAPFEEMNKNLNKLIENNEFRIKFPSDDESVIKSILQDGRYKTQFETETSGGVLNSYIRENASHNLFNTPSDTPKKDYEKYGYLGSKNEIKDNRNPQLGFYGDGIITLKKSEMMDRTTITVGDSLRDASDGRYIMGSKVTNVDSTVCVGRPSMIEEFNSRINSKIESNGINDASTIGFATRSYFELQYHGDVTLKDIESITVDKDILNELKKDSNLLQIMKDSNINFKYIENDEVKKYEL